LTNVTADYAIKIASLGLELAARQDSALALGVNTFAGQVTCAPVAEAHGLPFARVFDATPPRSSRLPSGR
jgi:alanine dehydrogenase